MQHPPATTRDLGTKRSGASAPASAARRASQRALAGWLLVVLSLLLPAAPVLADEPLVLGVFPRRPASDTRVMFQPLADYLSRELHRPVELVITPDFPSFWAAVEADRFDLMHSNQYQYVRAHKELGYRVIAINEEGGETTIRATIWVRRDSGIETAEDLRGRTVIFGGGKMAMVSYVMASELLRNAGLQESDYLAQFGINPTQALVALYHRQAMAAGLNRHADKQPRLHDEVDFSQLKPLLVSDPIPMLPWSVKAGLSRQLEQRLRRALLALSEQRSGREILAGAGLTGLAPARDSDFDGVRKLLLRTTGHDFRSD